LKEWEGKEPSRLNAACNLTLIPSLAPPQPLNRYRLSPIFTVEYITLGYDHPKSEEGVIRHYQPLGPIWCQVWCQNATILTVFADSSDY
jgi:hypothetical protein